MRLVPRNCERSKKSRCRLELGVDDRKKLYRLIAAALDERKLPASVELGTYFQVKLATAVHDVEDRIERFTGYASALARKTVF